MVKFHFLAPCAFARQRGDNEEMNDPQWGDVDHYLMQRLIAPDVELDRLLRASEDAGLPAIEVSPAQGKMLMLLVQISGATRVLEIGTLGGYSSVWMARGLLPGGRLITLEALPKHADVARANIRQTEVAGKIEVILGPAIESLARLVHEGVPPFDVVFIDADKVNNAKYLSWAMMLTKPGSLIVCDNVVRGGHIIDEEGRDEGIVGTRAFLDELAADSRLEATALQTVGVKGWDGFALARVK